MHGWGWGKRLLSIASLANGAFAQGSGDGGAPEEGAAQEIVSPQVVLARPPMGARRMLRGVQVVAGWGGSGGGANAMANTFAGNSGYVGGDLVANSNAMAKGRGGPATAVANSGVVNTGYVGGNVAAVSNAFASGR